MGRKLLWESSRPMYISNLVLALLGIASSPPTSSSPLEHLGKLDARAIPEGSGIVKSRRFPDVYWVHNDSGNPPVLFALRPNGQIIQRFRIAALNIDWEDITADDDGHLYLGDIGNNNG